MCDAFKQYASFHLASSPSHTQPVLHLSILQWLCNSENLCNAHHIRWKTQRQLDIQSVKLFGHQRAEKHRYKQMQLPLFPELIKLLPTSTSSRHVAKLSFIRRHVSDLICKRFLQKKKVPLKTAHSEVGGLINGSIF